MHQKTRSASFQFTFFIELYSVYEYDFGAAHFDILSRKSDAFTSFFLLNILLLNSIGGLIVEEKVEKHISEIVLSILFRMKLEVPLVAWK